MVLVEDLKDRKGRRADQLSKVRGRTKLEGADVIGIDAGVCVPVRGCRRAAPHGARPRGQGG